MRRSAILALAMGAVVMTLGAGTAGAGPLVDQAAPSAGFGADDGTELFVPNAQVVALEFHDLTDWVPGYTSTLGFYQASDPETLFPMFGDAGGLTPGRQVVVVDF